MLLSPPGSYGTLSFLVAARAQPQPAVLWAGGLEARPCFCHPQEHIAGGLRSLFSQEFSL